MAKRKNMSDDKEALLKALQKPVAGEAMGSGALGALLRADVKTEASREVAALVAGARVLRESAVLDMPAALDNASASWAPTAGLCGRTPVVLICEGLGNLRDRHYYGPEAIACSPRAFEGKPMFFDHPDEQEQRTRPERTVKDKVGFYKDLLVKKVKSPEGRMVDGCCGYAYYEATESGRLAYGKALAAIEYRRMFPNSTQEYVGLSINAGGEAEERTMTVDGQSIEVNYITNLEGISVDMVTSPARGGRFLARESHVGAHTLPSKEEDRMKLMEAIKAAALAVAAAESEKDPAVKDTKIAEAKKGLETLVKDAEKAIKEAATAEAAADKKKDEEDEAADKKKKEAAAAATAESDKAKDKETDEEKEKKAEAKKESSRLAANALVSESGVDEELVDMDGIAAHIGAGRLSEAKAQIAQVKKIQESAELKALGGNPGTKTTTKESAAGSMNAEFARCTQ